MGEEFNSSPIKEILKEIGKHRGRILNVSANSDNLKGTFRKHLTDAAANINAAMQVLGGRTANKESERLERINADLQSEINELRAEVELLNQENARRKWESGSSRCLLTGSLTVNRHRGVIPQITRGGLPLCPHSPGQGKKPERARRGLILWREAGRSWTT